MTCWDTKTRFQLALILTLIVTASFFIVIISVYILFATAWNRSEECDKLCRVMATGLRIASYYDPFTIPGWDVVDRKPSVEVPGVDYFSPYKKPNYTNHTDNFTNFEEENKTKAPPTAKNKKPKRFVTLDFGRKHFPSIAALLENLYFDDEDENFIKCAVVILSHQWALTTSSCVKGYTNKLETLSVRVNSDYWSKGGAIVSVKNLVPFEEMVAIEFGDVLTDFVPIEISELKPGEFDEASSFVWKGGLTGSLMKREKFRKLGVLSVELSKRLGFGYNKDECLENNSPLLYDNQLVGFQIDVDCKSDTFVFLNVYKYRNWLKTLLNVL